MRRATLPPPVASPNRSVNVEFRNRKHQQRLSSVSVTTHFHLLTINPKMLSSTFMDDRGKPSFNLLQHHKENAQALVYYVFDVLAFRGRDVRRLKLPERRGLLEELLRNAQDPVRVSPVLDAAP